MGAGEGRGARDKAWVSEQGGDAWVPPNTVGCGGVPVHSAVAGCGMPGLLPAPSLGQFGGAAAVGGAPPPSSRGLEPPRSDGSRCGQEQLQARGGLQPPPLSHPVLGESHPECRSGALGCPQAAAPPCTPRGSGAEPGHLLPLIAQRKIHVAAGQRCQPRIPQVLASPRDRVLLGHPLGSPLLLPPPPRMRMPSGWAMSCGSRALC